MNPDVELKYLNIIDGLNQIPTLPSVVSQLLKVINHPNSSADNAATLVEKDVALATKVLKLANSSYYGIPRTITNIRSAIVILGFSTVKSLVLSSSVLKMFDDNDSQALFDKNSFWKHSVEVAMMAKSLTKRTSLRNDADLAFSGGLLHDVGKLILTQYAYDDYKGVIEEAAKGEEPIIDIENRVMGITHSQISGMLLERWGIPESLQIPISYHDDPSKAGEHEMMSQIIHVANHLSTLNGSITIEGEKTAELKEGVLEALGFDMSAEDLLEDIRGDLSEVAEFIALIQGS